MADGFTFDVLKNMKQIEEYKCQILSSLASLFSDMTDSAATSAEFGASLSEMIMTAYLLGDKLGVSYQQMDHKIQNKIRAGILKEGNDKETAAVLALLNRHITDR